MLQPRQRASLLHETSAPPFKRLPMAIGFRPDGRHAVAVAEVKWVVLLQRYCGPKIDVLCLIRDAEPSRSHHAYDSITPIDYCIYRQSEASVHDVPQPSLQTSLCPPMKVMRTYDRRPHDSACCAAPWGPALICCRCDKVSIARSGPPKQRSLQTGSVHASTWVRRLRRKVQRGRRCLPDPLSTVRIAGV